MPNTFREQVFESPSNAESATCVAHGQKTRARPLKRRSITAVPPPPIRKEDRTRVLQETVLRKDTVNRGGTADIPPSVSIEAEGFFRPRKLQ